MKTGRKGPQGCLVVGKRGEAYNPLALSMSL